MNLLARRLPTILGLLLLLGIAGGLWWYIQSTRPVITDGIIPQKVRVTNVADNQMSVSWTTQGLASGQVEYGMAGEKLVSLASDDRGEAGGLSLVHHVTITDLQPNTEYAFRIISGETGAKFDNNGSPYSATTGVVIGETPAAVSLYGSVESLAGAQAVVYLAIPGAEPRSTLVTSSGSYSIPVGTTRSIGGRGFASYEPTTVASLSVEDGKKSATASLLMGGIAPIPAITMGQTHDFRANVLVEPEVAQVEPAPTPEPVSIFNVEPLGNGGVNSAEITILNPSVDGEELATTLPEFRGLAPAGVTLAITLSATITYSDSVEVATDGTWSWTPPEELTTGQHELLVSYVDDGGTEQMSEKSFFTSTVLAQGGDPAFESTPSAGTYASPTPTPTPSASARVTTPSTESGVPVSGILDYTLLTGAVGVVIMVLGAMVLAL